jgi:hypothetical protein
MGILMFLPPTAFVSIFLGFFFIENVQQNTPTSEKKLIGYSLYKMAILKNPV